MVANLIKTSDGDPVSLSLIVCLKVIWVIRWSRRFQPVVLEFESAFEPRFKVSTQVATQVSFNFRHCFCFRSFADPLCTILCCSLSRCEICVCFIVIRVLTRRRNFSHVNQWISLIFIMIVSASLCPLHLVPCGLFLISFGYYYYFGYHSACTFVSSRYYRLGS